MFCLYTRIIRREFLTKFIIGVRTKRYADVNRRNRKELTRTPTEIKRILSNNYKARKCRIVRKTSAESANYKLLMSKSRK